LIITKPWTQTFKAEIVLNNPKEKEIIDLVILLFQVLASIGYSFKAGY